MPIKIIAVHHANVHLKHPDDARDFYGRILGLKSDPRMKFNPERPNFWWRVGGQGIQIHSPCWGGGQGLGPDANHFALIVEDIEDAKQTLDAEGIAYLMQQPPGRPTQIFVQDPGGNTLELFQLAL